MSLIPDFKIGLFNVWLGIVPIFLSLIIIFVPNKKALKRGLDMSSYTMKEKLFTISSTGIFYLILIYSFFVPLKVGTIWFSLGLIFYLLGIIPFIIGMSNYASTPLSEPAVKGVYKVTRNPMYLFSSILVFGMGLTGASWLMIVLVFFYCILNHFIILAEEKYCSERYGGSYAKYSKTVPRYFRFL